MPRQHKLFREIYYCASVLTYSFSFLVFFWDLSSFLLRFSLFDLFGILSYQLSFTLLESLIITILVIMIVNLLPLREVREHRSAAGVLLLISFAGGSFLFKARRAVILWLSSSLLFSALPTGQFFVLLLMITIIVLPFIAIHFLRWEEFVDQIGSFVERLITLSNLYTLLGIIAILIVIYRNLP